MSKRKVEPGLATIFTDLRYRNCTIFLLLASFINQFSGVNAINIYSSSILAGIPGLPLATGVYTLAAANVFGSLCGPLVQKFVSIRMMLIVGQFVMLTFLVGIVVFSLLNIPIAILACMIGFIITYQCNIGSYYFVYVS